MIELLQGDAYSIPLTDESVHVCITSPPYWSLRLYKGEQARVWGGDVDCAHVWGDTVVKKGITGGTDNPFVDKLKIKGMENYQSFPDSDSQFCLHCSAWYGCLGLEPTPDLFVQHIVEVYREVWRVLHPSGTVWLNLGSSYAGSQKGIGADGKAYGGDKQRTNTGSMGLPVQDLGMYKPKDLVPVPWLCAIALQADGWWIRSAPPWVKRNPMPESCRDRPGTAHENWFLLTKRSRYFWDADAVRKPMKASSFERWKGKITSSTQSRNNPDVYPQEGAVNTLHKIKSGDILNPDGRNLRTSDFFYDSLDVLIDEQFAYLKYLQKIRADGGMLLDEDSDPLALCFNTRGYSGAHFATFPVALIEPLVKASTSEHGVCPECGCQWERVQEKTGKFQRRWSTKNKDGSPYNKQDSYQNTYETIGWQPTCDCCKICDHYNRLHGKQSCPQPYDPIPAVCLDPFVGSGTVLQVARQLGRSAIGIDLSHEYLQLARKRLSLDKLEVWERRGNKKKEPIDLTDLPLFKT